MDTDEMVQRVFEQGRRAGRMEVLEKISGFVTSLMPDIENGTLSPQVGTALSSFITRAVTEEKNVREGKPNCYGDLKI